MELSSHVTANLNDWVDSGFINDEQRQAFEQLIAGANEDAYMAGYAAAPSSIEYEKAYDDGWVDGNDTGRADAAAAYDDGYDAGYDAGLHDSKVGE